MKLAGKVALVTGATGSFGRAIARTLKQAGARVMLADLPAENNDSVTALLGELGAGASYVRLDVRAEKEWSVAVARCLSEFGQLNVLVNNAGISGGIDAGGDSIEAWDELMDVNAKGAFLGIRATCDALSRHGGSIVNISSVSALHGQPKSSHMGYHASKAAVHIMTKAAALRYAPAVRVNSVHPGIMPVMKTSKFEPAARANALAQVPLGREGRAEDVANAVLFLASEDACYITGAELLVDGGLMAG
ncbi:SDR family oxidoreductase [Ramlibacter ginsenosidimutans]|uniref:SDR family oxidoreductase n=1 Tax=Ramlibacter ginsenosidimutans TaxID=502333 RepID=A0A934WMZ0_9BURK|nr:SDR family NAD(P)-dependent oxidoreductase [Ramlibacter ginsenosidimutans]MBK6007146.1 SDR family oxidoreductase [Ramlibacter ginsenosidimutans]